jgi:SAM-dependent methyltransferase
MTKSKSPDYSESFYREHSERYGVVQHAFTQSIYPNASHPALGDDVDLLLRLIELTHGRKADEPAYNFTGLDAGCATARDTYFLWKAGYDIVGIDAVYENIETASTLHPEIADRLSVADLRCPLDFPEEFFDFIVCDAVIQHIEPHFVFGVTLPEFARVLKPGGVLQLMVKNKSEFNLSKSEDNEIMTVIDSDYGDAVRSFQLYDEKEILKALEALGLRLIEYEGPEKIGGMVYFRDSKPVDHCVFYLRKGE